VTDRLSPAHSTLPRSFYLRPTLTVAKDLLGRYLLRRIGRTLLIGKIVEVEAYLGELDPASHAFRGRTKRNEVMFERGGNLYVYFTYGMHFCCNVVTEEKGKGRAVLLRAVEPVGGIDLMARHRGLEDISDGSAQGSLLQLTNGPAKLCEAFRIRREQNGADLLGREIFIARGDAVRRGQIVSGPRIGIKSGKEKRWRFCLRGNPFVSDKRV
jgi:DNA-3-methyladenine glycosylase